MKKLYVVYIWHNPESKGQWINSTILEVEHAPLSEKDINAIKWEILCQINKPYTYVTIINWKELY